ncbi:MAG TPA: ABC transporter substrate-binding protein [Sporichthyaceae bacterium]|nr:ABC transporter substrate-binding protein [Sporichthyaceae bacterium]
MVLTARGNSTGSAHGTSMWRALLSIAGVLALAACGTRVSHQAVVAGAGAGTVSLDPSSIAALHSAVAADPARATTAVPSPQPPGTAAASQPSQTVSAPSDRSPAARTPDRRPGAVVAPGKAAQAWQAVVPAGSAEAPTNTRCTRSSEPVAIGQVGTFSGLAGTVTAPIRAALAVWAKDVNARGGLACHPVAVWSDDDGGDPARAAAEVQELVAEHHVVALVGNLVAASINGFAPAVAAAKIPAIGGGSYTMQDFDNRWFFPDGASVQDQVMGVLRDGVDQGHRRLGALYCVEATVCTQADEYFKNGAAPAGAAMVYNAPVSITQPDYTAQCLNARDAKVDLLGVALDGASIGRVARSCTAIGYRPVFAASAAVFGPDQANDPTIRSFGVVTITTEAPWFLDDQPGLRAFHEAMDRWAPTSNLTNASLIGWTSAELFRAAVEKVADQAGTGPITPELVLTGLGRIHDDTLGGLTGPLTFTPDETHATSNGCVFYELLTTAGWAAPRGSRPVCTGH